MFNILKSFSFVMKSFFLLLSIPLLLSFLSGCGGGADSPPLDPMARALSTTHATGPVIAWAPSTVSVEAAAALHLSASVSFTAAQATSTSLVVEPNPGLASIVSVTNGVLPPLQAGDSRTINFTVNVPAGTPLGTVFQGTLQAHPVGSNSVTAKPLPITVMAMASPFPIARATVTLDPALPNSASSKVTSVVSLVDSVAPGAALTVPTAPNTQALVFGVDSSQTPWLAQLGNGNQVLSAESTAIVFARMAMGSIILPAGLTSSVIDSLITSATAFPALKAVIASALAAGTAPINAPELPGAVGAVIQEIQPQAAQALQTAQATGAKRAHALSTAQSEVAALPYYLLNSGATNRLWVSDLPGTQNVQLNNQTFLAWAVTGASSFSGVVNPLNQSLWTKFAYYGGSASTLTVTGDTDFTMTVSQNAATEIQNGQTLATNVAASIIGVPLTMLNISQDQAIACEQSIYASLVNSPEFSAALAQHSSAAFFSYLKTTAISLYLDGLTSCASSIPPLKYLQLSNLGSAGAGFMFIFSKAWEILNLTSTLNATVNVFSQFLTAASSEPYVLHMCKVDGVIGNCVDASVFLGSLTWSTDPTYHSPTTPYECCKYVLVNAPFIAHGIAVAPNMSNARWDISYAFSPSGYNPNAFVHFYGTGSGAPPAPVRTDGGTLPNAGAVGWGVSVHTGGQYKPSDTKSSITFTAVLIVSQTDPVTGMTTSVRSNRQVVSVPLS